MSWSFCFWEPNLSPHKLDLFKALVRSSPPNTCIYIAQEGLPVDRAAQGWALTDLNDIEVRIGPSKHEIEAIVEAASRQTIHLFSGIHWAPCLVMGLQAVIAKSRVFAIMAEPRESEGVLGAMRWVHSWLTERAIRRRVAFVLAIGANGPRWFGATGYRRERIFPFAYFLPPSDAPPGEPEGRPVTVGYVGRLTLEKGIALFLAAARELPSDCAVVVAGAGPEAPRVRELAETAPNVTFLGTLSMQEVGRLLASTDILVVPSLTTDDGWAAVVSEALMAGAAVIASWKAGASLCLADRSRGVVLKALNKEALVEALRSGLKTFDFSAQARRRRAQWAQAHLTGEAGAAYLRAIASHVLLGAPRPPPFFL